MKSQEAYFARRAREEREAAEEATSALARQSHLDVARRYQELADLEAETRRHLESWAGLKHGRKNAPRSVACTSKRSLGWQREWLVVIPMNMSGSNWEA